MLLIFCNLKKILITAIIICICVISFARDEKKNIGISYGIEYGYSINLKTTSPYPIEGTDYEKMNGSSLRINLGYFINPKIYAGISSGLDGYSTPVSGEPTMGSSAHFNTFKLVAQGRYYLNDAKNSFYPYIEMGPNLQLTESFEKGYSLGLGIGYKFFIGSRFCMQTSMGYTYDKMVDDSYFSPLEMNLVRIVVGIHF